MSPIIIFAFNYRTHIKKIIHLLFFLIYPFIF